MAERDLWLKKEKKLKKNKKIKKIKNNGFFDFRKKKEKKSFLLLI